MANAIQCRKVYKYRVEPTVIVAPLELERTASVARYIYNWLLGRCQASYRQDGKTKPWIELSAKLTELKRTEFWLCDFDSQMMQQALANLKGSYLIRTARSRLPHIPLCNSRAHVYITPSSRTEPRSKNPSSSAPPSDLPDAHIAPCRYC